MIHMRKALCHWFRITEAEERELWKSGIFSFDASVLLSIYEYSNETRNELVKLIEDNSQRVRLPYQFGLEYVRNRSSVIIKQSKNYVKAVKDLESFQIKHIESKNNHPYLSESSLEAFKEIQSDLTARQKEMECLIGSDPYADKVLTVFEGRLGPKPTPEELTLLHERAKERYDKKRPPGYSDLKGKGAPDAYGDFIGWSQLIEIAKKEQKGVILVLDDSKEDWWLKREERKIGPHPDLVEEFSSLTQQRLWIYTSENFLRAAKKFVAAEISDEVIEEVTQRLASQQESQRVSDTIPETLGPAFQKAFGGYSDADKLTRQDFSPAKSTYGDSEKLETNTEED